MSSGEKFVSPEQPPEGIDREILTILMEECAEVQQRASKALRFGIEEVESGQPWNNAERLSVEVGDLLHLVERCSEQDLLVPEIVEGSMRLKRTKLDKYLQSI